MIRLRIDQCPLGSLSPLLIVSDVLVQRIDQQRIHEYVAAQSDAHRDDERAVFRDDTVPEQLPCRVNCWSLRGVPKSTEATACAHTRR
jgi:hypothetical protein